MTTRGMYPIVDIMAFISAGAISGFMHIDSITEDVPEMYI